MAIYSTNINNLTQYFNQEINKQFQPVIKSVKKRHLNNLRFLLDNNEHIKPNSQNGFYGYDASFSKFIASINNQLIIQKKTIIPHDYYKNVDLAILEKIIDTNDSFNDSTFYKKEIPPTIFSYYYFSNYLLSQNNTQLSESHEYKIYSTFFHILNLNKQLYIPKFDFGTDEEVPISPINDIESYAQVLAFEHLNPSENYDGLVYFQSNSKKSLIEELLGTTINPQSNDIYHKFYNAEAEFIFYPDDIINYVQKVKLDLTEAAKKAEEVKKLNDTQKNTTIKDIFTQNVGINVQNEMMNIDSLTSDEFIHHYFTNYDLTYLPNHSPNSIFSTTEYNKNKKTQELLEHALGPKIEDFDYFSAYLIGLEQKYQNFFKNPESTLNQYIATLSLLSLVISPFNKPNSFKKEHFDLIEKHLSLETIACMSFHHFERDNGRIQLMQIPFHNYKKLRSFNFLYNDFLINKDSPFIQFFENKLNLFIDNIEKSDPETLKFFKTNVGEELFIIFYPFLKSKTKSLPNNLELLNFDKIEDNPHSFFGAIPLPTVLNEPELLKKHFKLLDNEISNRFTTQQHNFTLSLYEHSIIQSINNFSSNKPFNLEWIKAISYISNISTMLLNLLENQPNFLKFIEHLHTHFKDTKTINEDNPFNISHVEKLIAVLASGYINEYPKAENSNYFDHYKSFIDRFSDPALFTDFFNRNESLPGISKEKSFIYQLLLKYSIEKNITPQFIDFFNNHYKKNSAHICSFFDNSSNIINSEAFSNIFSNHQILDIMVEHQKFVKYLNYPYQKTITLFKDYHNSEYLHPMYLKDKLDSNWIKKNLIETPMEEKPLTEIMSFFSKIKNKNNNEYFHTLHNEVFSKKNENLSIPKLHQQFISSLYFSSDVTLYYTQPILLSLIKNFSNADSVLLSAAPYSLRTILKYSLSDPEILNSFFINKDNNNLKMLFSNEANTDPENKPKQLKF